MRAAWRDGREEVVTVFALLRVVVLCGRESGDEETAAEECDDVEEENWFVAAAAATNESPETRYRRDTVSRCCVREVQGGSICSRGRLTRSWSRTK